MSAELSQLLAELRIIGQAATPAAIETTVRRCAEVYRAHPRPQVRTVRDLAYGPHPRMRLNMYGPPKPSAAGLPVLLFVHGGGFHGGDKDLPGLPFFDHVGGWAVAHGMVGVTITYRLSPEHPWPAGAQDVAAAVAWTRANAARHGGDPERVVVVGHSAGAAHVAGFLAGHGGAGAAELRAAVLLSGIYDIATARPAVTTDDQDESLSGYFGDDRTSFPARSALPGLEAATLPVLFGVAEFDWPVFQAQALVVVAAMSRRRRVMPPFVWVSGHNHFSEILTLGVDDEAFGNALARFLRRWTS